MLAISSHSKIFICRNPTDMRKSYNGLIALVQNHFKQNPLAGDFFVFSNKRCNSLKIIFWDTGGFCLYCKRLEKGVFKFPQGKNEQIERASLALILEGFEVKNINKLSRFRP
jgi:transposase